MATRTPISKTHTATLRTMVVNVAKTTIFAKLVEKTFKVCD
jgi:hypothetical protein